MCVHDDDGNKQLLAMIGEQFDESEEICGVVVSVRRQDKIALWTKHAQNEAAQVCPSGLDQFCAKQGLSRLP